MKSIIDATAFIGDYPFRGFSKTSPGDYKILAQRYGITGAVVSSFYEIFWENNLDAARRTHDEIGDDSFFHHFPVVNPVHPGQLAELPQVLDALKVRGIRLTPAYHRYRLWDAPVQDVFQIAAERGLAVQIFRTIQDERMHWMLSVPPVPSEDFERLVATPPPIDLVLSGLQTLDINRLSQKLPTAARANIEQEKAPKVCFDLSRVRGPVFAIESLAEKVGADKLLFGSLWPIQLVGSTVRQIEDARMSEEDRARIMGGNMANLLESKS